MISSISNSVPVFPSLKNNLIQNFYIIGLSPDDFIKIDKKENKLKFFDLFENTSENFPLLTPKIITKFPNEKNGINTIPDNIIIEHCFPKGKIEFKNNDKKEFFQFEFDNIPQNYFDDDKQFYSKIYFNCLSIKEPLIDYFKYKKEIVNLILEKEYLPVSDSDKNFILGLEEEKKYSNIFIPKIICFSSILPFYNELGLILDFIYSYYLSKEDFSSLSLEKVIEKIIMKIPIPVNLSEELSINFNTYNFKQKLTFPHLNINEMNINYFSNVSLGKLFEFFPLDDIIKIFRYILYEIPILFFSNSKFLLSLFVNTFLTVLSPFKYVFPHVAILPQKLYGLINSEKKFIFGINELYQENFFENNKIELNKTLVIISVDTSAKNLQGKIEEKIYENSLDKIYITTNHLTRDPLEAININGNKVPILNVDFPYNFKKKLSEGLSKYLSFLKKKSFFSKKETIPKDFTFKIQNVFYKFFVSIMQGYTDFLYKSKYLYNDKFSKNINIGENTFIKMNENFKKEVFNEDEFLSKAPKDSIPFYKIFFNTDMFIFFLRERIYSKGKIDQLKIRQFEQLTYLKKHTDLRKKKENKTFYENFRKDIFEKVKYEIKNEILIKEEETFNNEELENYLQNKEKNVELLINYGQLFKLKENKTFEKNNLSNIIDINYLIFPKLNFEYLYKGNGVQIKSLNDQYLVDFKNICKKNKKELKKIRPYVFCRSFFKKLPQTNNSGKNYGIHSKYYILFVWFLLLSSSLWYCEEDEKNYRLDKMFANLNNFEIMEEYVLNFIFINIYKSSDIFHLVKLFILFYKMIGHINYYLLNLFCDKIQSNTNSNNNESENSLNNNIESKKDLVFSKRYLIGSNNNFIEDNEIKENKDINQDNKGDLDELIFCSEQKCPKCNDINNIDMKKLIDCHIDLSIENHKYQCQKCKEINDIIIKYQILKYNYNNKTIFLIENGHFKFLTPYKLYRDLKSFFIKENITQLDIDNILNIGSQFNFYNIIFYFSLLNIPFDFLFPYESRLNANIKLSFNNNINNENISIKRYEKPVKFNFENNQISFRRFNNIQPLLNQKKKSTKILGIIKREDKYVDSDLSFTIKKTKGGKNSKKK